MRDLQLKRCAAAVPLLALAALLLGTAPARAQRQLPQQLEEVRIDQRLRVDHEAAAWLNGVVGGRPRLVDHLFAAQQDAATLLGRSARGLGEQAFENRS